jgi:hypothetical protein
MHEIDRLSGSIDWIDETLTELICHLKNRGGQLQINSERDWVEI